MEPLWCCRPIGSVQNKAVAISGRSLPLEYELRATLMFSLCKSSLHLCSPQSQWDKFFKFKNFNRLITIWLSSFQLHYCWFLNRSFLRWKADLFTALTKSALYLLSSLLHLTHVATAFSIPPILQCLVKAHGSHKVLEMKS